MRLEVGRESATVRPSRMTVISSEIANTSSSRCETNTTAQLRRFEPSDDVEQPLDLARAQRRRRLVEDDQARIERERLGDLDELSLRRREVARLGVERQRALLAEIGEDFAGATAHGRPRKAARPPELGQKDVFEHGKIGREARLLHHHRDAGVERLARRANVQRAAAIDGSRRCRGATCPEITRDSVDLPAPLAPSSAWVAPARSVRLAPASARVSAKLLQTPRASSSVDPASVMASLCEGRRSAPAVVRTHGSSLANTVCLMVGRIWSMFLLVAITIGTRISLSGLPPFSAVTSASPDLTPIR